MALVTLKHTFAAVDIIKKKLQRFLYIFNIVLNVVFLFYYAYLIYSNVSSPLYLTLYIIMATLSLTFFILDLTVFKTKQGENKFMVKIKAKNKKIVKFIVKNTKYICKGIIVILALIEILTDKNVTALTTVSTLVSAFLLVAQIIAELVVIVLEKSMDVLKLAIQKDIEESAITKVVNFKQSLADKWNAQADALEGKEAYSKSQQTILDHLRERAQILEEGKKNDKKSLLRESWLRLKEAKQKAKAQKKAEKEKLKQDKKNQNIIEIEDK